MSNKQYILSIDQGTSSTKSLIFDELGQAVAKGVEILDTFYGNDGIVEQDPEAIYQNVLASVKKCIQQYQDGGLLINDIAGIGISNQRETFVVWDKNGKPLHNAIVWQCKRSTKICEALKAKGLSEIIQKKTGLVIDPYFSGTKLMWLFENNEAIRTAIQNENAYFGTIDSWLLYKFSKGTSYATDFTNASRTLFFNLHTLSWDKELIGLFGLTGIHLPVIKASSALFAETDLEGIFKKPIPVAAMIGDSHAAAFGEGCFEAGTAKATLGTGCSILMNIGDRPFASTNGMVTTVCWSTEHRVDYALEGVIVSCGSTIEWLKNELNLFTNSKQTEAMALAVPDNGGVYFVPAFSGLGSPHWQMDRRASISGMSFGTTKNNIVRAALESIPYQVKDVITAMEKDAVPLKKLNADGGMTSNSWLMQFLADQLNKEVSTIGFPDISALGAALLAGLKLGVYPDIDSLTKMNRNEKVFKPATGNDSEKNYMRWKAAILNSK